MVHRIGFQRREGQKCDSKCVICKFTLSLLPVHAHDNDWNTWISNTDLIL